MASAWEELKRRNVVRVAVAYVIVSWLILQLSDVLIPMLTLPEWVGRLVFLLLLIGFPLALFFSWAFELTPGGLKKEKDVDRSESITHLTDRKLDFAIIGVLVVALGMFAVDKFVLAPDSITASDADQDFIATEVRQSIAVLPFVNMSPDPDQEYFSDGLSEEILNLLAKIPELKVIGRTSSFAFKGKDEDLRVIGEALGVNFLLEGSVRKSDDRVRITAQLNDASDGSHIWSETYDRTMTDIFAVQDDVATAIIDALQIHVGTNPTRGQPTDNARAYALFLRARAPRHPSDWRDTEALLLQVIDLDPEFAEAHEQLANLYWSLSGQFINAAKGRKLTHDAAANALAIDPDLVLAQAMYETSDPEDFSHLRDIETFERAASEEPGRTEILRALAYSLMHVGYLREALGVAERLVEIEPLSPSANGSLFGPLYAAGRTSEAVAALNVVFDKFWLGEVYLAEKQDDIAIANFEAIHKQVGLPFNWVKDLVIGARDPTTGQAHLDRRIPQIIASFPEIDRAVTQQSLTRWYLYFGFLDRYFETILDFDLADPAWTDADLAISEGTIYRRFGFTAHPKYLEVAELRGIIDVWEHRGPPDFCEKVGGQWVCE